ncbi:basic proline-rich protein-like [Antechinus flavipes]|uniref:basic proline-rich protein-like n=1 Tax=Antechinus flavipes TaxID=38775 RepID=UPI0022357321|nr:basic proline-rich protein-like [Antechinus flavipes]
MCPREGWQQQLGACLWPAGPEAWKPWWPGALPDRLTPPGGHAAPPTRGENKGGRGSPVRKPVAECPRNRCPARPEQSQHGPAPPASAKFPGECQHRAARPGRPPRPPTAPCQAPVFRAGAPHGPARARGTADIPLPPRLHSCRKQAFGHFLQIPDTKRLRPRRPRPRLGTPDRPSPASAPPAAPAPGPALPRRRPRAPGDGEVEGGGVGFTSTFRTRAPPQFSSFPRGRGAAQLRPGRQREEAAPPPLGVRRAPPPTPARARPPAASPSGSF